MFSHIYANRIKVSLRDRQMLFWTFLFPIILATFFSMAFANLSSNETFTSIPIAVVNNEAYRSDTILQEVLDSASQTQDSMPGEKPLFIVEQLSLADAGKSLEDGRIAGYLVAGEPLTMVVSGSGIRQTILKSFMDDYLQTRAAVEQIIEREPSAASSIMEQAGQRIQILKDRPISSVEPDTVLTYYYALIAMTCLYGGYWGLKEVISIQANMSPQAARLNVTPVHKMKIFASSLLAALTIHYLSIIILLVYLRLVLGIHLGRNLGMMLLSALSGSLLGVSIGSVLASLTRWSEGVKSALMTGFSMICSFLAGLMIVDIKYITIKAFPAISYLNPANLISDAFYALYYYDTLERTWLNIGLQILASAVLFSIIALFIRRRRYASI
jgi:ABC-2 type transport system permease protein